MEEVTTSHLSGSSPGASATEYLIATAGLVLVFAIVGALLYDSSAAKRDRSMEAVEHMSPCLPGKDADDEACF